MIRLHKPAPPTTTEHGDEEHPAWGVLSAHRVTSTPPAVLFDSEIKHTTFIRVELGRMTRGRDLKRDWLMQKGGLPLVQIDMSEAQWAAFVSSIGTSGVPVTIRMTETEHDVPGLEFAPRLALSAQETRNAAAKAFAQIKEAVDELEALDPKAGIKARREAIRKVRLAVDRAPSNVEFAAESLTEHVEATVTKARADIEAMVATHAEKVGLDQSQARAALTEGLTAE